MKKQEKQNKRETNKEQEELQTFNQKTISEYNQPVPQPKDYDEIEY